MKKANKILVLGVDGMDPRLSKKLMDDGRMPNLKRLYDEGACLNGRENYFSY